MGGIPRNAPCPCGSGKKYKRCCGNVIQFPTDHAIDIPKNSNQHGGDFVSAADTLSKLTEHLREKGVGSLEEANRELEMLAARIAKTICRKRHASDTY